MKKLAFIIIFVFSTISVLAQAKAVIRISSENTIETDKISLGGIAQITFNSEKMKRLQDISLGFAPNVGMLREINRDRISLAISAAGFLENEFTLIAPPKISVRRLAQVVNQDSIRQAVVKAVAANFQNPDIEIKITKLTFPEKIEIPKGNVAINIANFSGVSNFLAPFIVSLEIKVDDKVMSRISANVELEMFAEVLVVSKNLSVNDKISETDVRKERVRLDKSLVNYVCDIDKLHGKKLLKNLTAGMPLTNDAIIADAVIRAGDSVKIIGQAGKMQIIVAGEARASGRIGDRIAVKNSQSGVMLQAIVIDEGIVKINF